jgi:hypothetical protein
MEDMAIEPDFEVSYLMAVICCSGMGGGRDGGWDVFFLRHRVYTMMRCYSSLGVTCVQSKVAW